MHPTTFLLVFVTLFAVLSVAHPIPHHHRVLKVKVRENERACKPSGVTSSAVDPPASTPVPTEVSSDVPKSDAEPSSVSFAKPSFIAKPSSSLVPTSTKSNDEEGESTSTPVPTSTKNDEDSEPTSTPVPTSTKNDDDSEPTSTQIPTSTKSGDEPTGTPSTGGGGSLTDKLFPSGFGKESWTTAEGIDGALPLSDATLKPTKVLKALSRDIVKAPDGKLGMQAHYPKGSYTFGHDPQGGFSFYAKGPSDVDLSTALEATFGYSVYFEEDFDYQLGGKLLGFCG
jgi:hypothetical protein